MSTKPALTPAARRAWASLPESELLSLRFRELGLKMPSQPIADEVDELYATLGRRGVRFRPHVWFSTDWFSPDGIPGIAIPFFLAHPRLTRLERRMKGTAEGGRRDWRQQILRHEAGHAIDTAYGLRRRPDWRAVFGPASQAYPGVYCARPASRRYVLHLDYWYAQSHPTEDFAETFAVWLQPRARWRRDYDGWPALQKLEFVDRLMQEIAGRRPRNSDRSIIAPVSENSRRLREHYRRNSVPVDRSEKRYDSPLLRAFAPASRHSTSMRAAKLLREIGPELKSRIAPDSRSDEFVFDHAAKALRRRAGQLKLVLRADRRDAKRRALGLHEQVMTDILKRNREYYRV